MKIVGSNGRSAFLVAESINAKTGRILDTDRGRISPEMDVDMILKWGYWEEYHPTKEELEKILKGVDLKGVKIDA